MNESEQEMLFDEALGEEQSPARRQALNRLLAANPAARSAWIAHRRLAVRIRALAPSTDLGVRILEVARAGRESRRQAVSNGVLLRLAKRRRRQWLIGATALAASLLIALATVAWPQLVVEPRVADDRREQIAELHHADGRREPILEGATVTAEATLAVRWRDGSVADLTPGTQVMVAHDGLRLASGAVDCSIVPRPGAPFHIDTKHAQIAVIGTRFHCTADEQGSAVSVSEGNVRMAAAGSELLLAPGEAARAFTGSAPRRERVILRWPGDGAKLRSGVVDGSGILRSSIDHEDVIGRPYIRFNTLTNGRALFDWRPGLVLRAAIRCQDQRMKHLTLQCSERKAQINQFKRLTVPVLPGGWTVATFDLDGLRRPEGQTSRTTADQIDALLLYPGDKDANTSFELVWVEVVEPMP